MTPSAPPVSTFCTLCGETHDFSEQAPNLGPRETAVLIYTPPAVKSHIATFAWIAGTDKERQQALERFNQRYSQTVSAFKRLSARNKEGQVPGRVLQDYYCIGCVVRNGQRRRELFSIAAAPLLLTALGIELQQQFSLQCYFPQTYELEAGEGPGGIIGTVHGWDPQTVPDVTASRAWKYWNWVDEVLPVYLPEEEAETALWKMSYVACARAKFWLRALPEALPPHGVAYPPELTHELITLLGVAALQRLAAQELGRDFVLLDDSRIILRENLHWNLLT